MEIYVFDHPVNQYLRRQRREEEAAVAADPFVDSVDHLPRSTQAKFSFNRLMGFYGNGNGRYVGCHRVFGNLGLN